MIDVYLQQRFDLIPNLVEVTKEYSHYESSVLEHITELRTSFQKDKNIEACKELNSQYFNLIALVEDNPNLKASEQFIHLQKSLVKVESELQAARRLYNNNVTKFNTQITIFPNNLLARLFHFQEFSLFSLDGEKEVNIKF